MKENSIDLFIQLAFETGQAYQNIYNKLGLENVIDFNDIVFANSRGAQWKTKGRMLELPRLFEIHKIKKEGINELNNLADQLNKIKIMAKEVICSERKNKKNNRKN